MDALVCGVLVMLPASVPPAHAASMPVPSASRLGGACGGPAARCRGRGKYTSRQGISTCAMPSRQQKQADGVELELT